ncbi:GntR family transcriptional regulator [Roseinatronobacter sp. S2]|uniref:GntR family transcriptional regulator n=1 Tax=Roseinatronobacter sp. S2 TaxID=3035471 RepID=UPI00240EA155|nr:GntR family transcriptional regulator [Roseinatronobacter sp. S2]WFE76814.1 GntR family transcriptional regulator [Roseinatronobacter sp. S2]
MSQLLPPLDAHHPRSMADQVYDLLYERIINLMLPPGTKLSEAEVAAQLGVSRQPVRDAFYRLSQLGLIHIRPQRATTVAPISKDAIVQAYFIRSALEEATMRVAAEKLEPVHITALQDILNRQEDALRANDKTGFHALDDQFHHDICTYAGLGFGWALIKDNKGHMDRARYLSLSFEAPRALAEHHDILNALRAGDGDGAAAAVKTHLSHIGDIIDWIQANQPEVF